MVTSTRDPASRGRVRRSTPPLLAGVLCAALVAGTPTAAHAKTISDPDTVGDMITFNDQDAVVLVPERTLNDVRNTTLRHGARRVAAQVDYVDLKQKAGGDYQSLGILMLTNEGVRRFVSLDAWRRHWSGDSQMYNGKHHAVRCAVRHSTDYEANMTKVSFPRRCASNPRWVEFRVWAQSSGDDGYNADDALHDRPIDSQAGHMKRSARLHREGIKIPPSPNALRRLAALTSLDYESVALRAALIDAGWIDSVGISPVGVPMARTEPHPQVPQVGQKVGQSMA